MLFYNWPPASPQTQPRVCYDISKVMTSQSVGGFHHVMFRLNHCHICRPLLAKAALYNIWLLFYVCMYIHTQVYVFQNSALHSCGEEYCWRILRKTIYVYTLLCCLISFMALTLSLSFMKTIWPYISPTKPSWGPKRKRAKCLTLDRGGLPGLGP